MSFSIAVQPDAVARATQAAFAFTKGAPFYNAFKLRAVTILANDSWLDE
jgi:hypothetical protein